MLPLIAIHQIGRSSVTHMNNKPASQRQPVTTEIDGKTYSGTYTVQRPE
jgi:hypothetical protein